MVQEVSVPLKYRKDMQREGLGGDGDDTWTCQEWL